MRRPTTILSFAAALLLAPSARCLAGEDMGPLVRFHSGGTAPTAFNPRTNACLVEIGVEIEPTGTEATRGELKTANPIYKIR